jgi:hypothetical protein
VQQTETGSWYLILWPSTRNIHPFIAHGLQVQKAMILPRLQKDEVCSNCRIPTDDIVMSCPVKKTHTLAYYEFKPM